MRPLSSLHFLAVLLCTLLIPAAGKATPAPSWCVPQATMPNPPPASADATTKAVVPQVCNSNGFGMASCCSTRWSLLCVQKGADWWAKQPNSIDVCGRFEWSQLQVPGTQQHFPHDFNLVTLAGDTSGFQDIQGPVLVNGNVTSATGVSLNGYSHLPFALIATGNVSLSSGSVFGNVLYGTYSPQNIRYINGAPTQEDVIEKAVLGIFFVNASLEMQGLSGTLSGYPANGTSARPLNKNQTVGFTGTDPELNVFSLSSDLFIGTTEYSFNVPLGSAAIINVIGTNPVIQNAGFDGPNDGVNGVPSNGKILWNFPSATTLAIKSVTFPGSILAPIADASFNYGQINGTVVVKSAVPEWMEFHWAPFHGLATSGCLEWDASWSCSGDTYLDDTEHVVFPAPEAGFLQIDGGPYTAEGVPRTSPTHRIWYSFQPAVSSPESKPLAVMFNGGPGTATSALMFSFNTGTWTLDPAWAGGQRIVSNPNNWTQFANLLYIDAPATGFSYPLPYNNTQQDIGIDIDRDAGIFLRVITKFLLRHPVLEGNRVILVGESYGGTRATLMLNYLYNYTSVKPNSGAAYQDQQLSDDLNSYFVAVFNGNSSPSPTQILGKFGHQVLVQPAVAGYDQEQRQQQVSNSTWENMQNNWLNWTPSGCVLRPGLPCYVITQDYSGNITPPTCDPYDCDKANNLQPNNEYWATHQFETAATNLNNHATLPQALGIDCTTIEWMHSRSRTGAYGRGAPDGFSSSDMQNTFGKIDSSSDDNYFVTSNGSVFVGYGYVNRYNKPPYTAQNPAPARQWDDYQNSTYVYMADTGIPIGLNFLNNMLSGVATFIPVTQFDSVIWTPSIEGGLNDGNFSSLVSSAKYSQGSGLSITYNSNVKKTATMSLPYASGHSVSMRAPAALLGDVMAWYAASPH
jgi:choice-of-anchor A domain-containing protein